jgi:hypothetical protein
MFFIYALCCYRSRMHGVEQFCPTLCSAKFFPHVFLFLSYFSLLFQSLFFYRCLVFLFHLSVCVFFSLFCLFTMFSFISLCFIFFTSIHLTVFFVLFLQSLQLRYLFMPWKRYCKTIVSGTRWRRWSRHCAISRKVARSMEPVGCFISAVLWSFRRLSPQPLTEMSNTRVSPKGKGSRCVWLTSLSPRADCLEILGVSTSWSHRSLSRPA